jgi:hypothetical protein
MKKSKIIGYIVEGRWGAQEQVDGILYYGKYVTIFPNLRAAKKAVKASLKFAISQGYGTSHGDAWQRGIVRPVRK